MFMIVAAFLFGYCFGYYLFEFFKYKNQKEDIIEFLSSYNKRYGSKYGTFNKRNTKYEN